MEPILSAKILTDISIIHLRTLSGYSYYRIYNGIFFEIPTSVLSRFSGFNCARVETKAN